jgi:tetratricopeptide (TPR) repeat protein
VEEKPKYKFLSPEPLKKRLFKTKWFISLVVVVVVALVGVYVGWVVVSNKDLAEFFNLTSTSKETQLTDTKTLDYINNAEANANIGDIELSVSFYNQAISEISGDHEKSQLILSKATIYLNDGDYDNSLLTAQEALSLESSYATNSFIAMVYEKMYDYEKALNYYKIAFDLAVLDQEIDLIEKEYMQMKIEELINIRDTVFNGVFDDIIFLDEGVTGEE